MALPSNSFMFNYNAKNYDAVTRTFPKTQGQLFDEDLVLNANPTGVYEEYVDMTTTNPYYSKTYSSSSDNPFNRSSGNNSFTFIYKAASFSSNITNIFANRNSSYNYMVRGSIFHTSSPTFLTLTPPTDIHICIIRIYNSGLSERFFVDSSGTVISSTSASTVSWGSTNNGISFFTGQANSNFEAFHGKFYWMYCSLETLTDAEIQQVINYNEKLGSLGIDPESMSFDYTGGTSALTITCDEGWTASTNDSWLALSSTTGTGDSTITVTVNENTSFQGKLGTINVTDGSDTLTCSISQEKHPILVKSDNIYFEDIRVNKMYLNGSLIYRNLIPTVVFDVDESSETIEYTGGTFDFTVYANKLWTITSPEWVTLSKTSGYSTNTITATVGQNPSEDAQRTGTITVSCNGVAKQINVSQKFKIDYSTYLTFEIISGGTFGCAFWVNINWEYTTDDGATWTTPSYGGFSINVNAGDIIKMRGNESGGYGNYYIAWYPTTAKFNVYGNVMSIIDSVNYATMTTVPSNCFKNLFNYCAGLTSAENLILPATTLADNCYSGMFNLCTSLTTAPELPATTLAPNCYVSMFQGCSSLNYIKCLATNISASSCITGWVAGVSATGTFVKNPNMSSWTTGYDGIPNGWTVVDSE